MTDPNVIDLKRLSKLAGWSMLAMIGIGIATSVLIARGIDINLNADVATTAENMLQAEQRLRAKAYIGIAGFGLEALFAIALFLVLRAHGPVLAAWSTVASLVAATLVLLGAVFAMNAAELAANPVYLGFADGAYRLPLAGLQATSDYTSFHLSLVLSSLAKAGFFYLLLTSQLIPRLIAAWGLFASLFVAGTVVARDFIPALGADAVTYAFMISNLIALVSLGVCLAFWGIRRAQ